jgi:signal transduction histidine kinase
VAADALRVDIPEALEFISNAVDRMDRLIAAILNLSRMGYRELEPERLNTGHLVYGTLETLAYQINRHQVTVTVGDLPEIIADRVAMEQIFANLLTNAVNYLDPERPGVIRVTGERLSDETVFRVQDNGIGMPAEDLERIFQVFQRAGALNVPGEGMGLAYVRTLVRRHGGRIWCESEPGNGSTFVFTVADQIKDDTVGAQLG